jgi:hypothetical protein
MAAEDVLHDTGTLSMIPSTCSDMLTQSQSSLCFQLRLSDVLGLLYQQFRQLCRILNDPGDA